LRDSRIQGVKDSRIQGVKDSRGQGRRGGWMKSGLIKTFRDLLVWQKAFDLCVEIYRLSGEFPRHELYGLSSELRKTSRSVVCNIAEGHKRRSTREYIHFLRIAAGSEAELESQILLSERLGYIQNDTAEGIHRRLAEIERMLAALIRSLTSRLAGPPQPPIP
jgi:four helix bundle protein